MTPLNRKLLRELWKLKGQMFSIILVVASGVMTVVTLRGTYDSLVVARDQYYADYRFAEVWAALERAPDALAERVAELPGVAAVDTRVAFYARLDLPGLEAPGSAFVVSLPDRGRPALNDLHLRSGRTPSTARRDEVVVSARFAEARGYRIGDSIRAILNGRLRTLDIVGIAISPEHTYTVPPGTIFPDDTRYGVLWMPRGVLAPAYDMEGGFNQIALSLSEGADEDRVISELDRLLEPYGGLGAYGRDLQGSHRAISDELQSNRTTGTAIPIIFLGVAAFLLNLVLGRLIATQRSEIGVLKAFGYRDSEVGRHFLLFALAPVAIGAVLGTWIGAVLGDGMVSLYAEYFDFPVLEFVLSWPLALLAIGVSALAAGIGAGIAVRHAVRLPPAEAMRAEIPHGFKTGWFDRTPFGSRSSSSVRMIVRNVERQPIRGLLSALGVALSVSILVVGMFMFDAVDRMMELQFEVAQREDLSVSFQEVKPEAVRFAIGRIEGVERVEPYRVVPARLVAGHRDHTLGITGVESGSQLRRLVSANGAMHPIPTSGLVLSQFLAEKIGVVPGDEVEVRVLEGSRPIRAVQVVGTVDDFLGVSAWMELDQLQRLAGGGKVVSGVQLLVRADREPAVNRSLEAAPGVASVASPSSMLDSFQEQMDESLLIAVTFTLVFAGIIAIGIVYNGARIALSERGRELASLRVLGFTRREVSILLLGEQAIITVLAIPLGWGIGYLLAAAMFRAFEQETYRIPLVVSAETYVWSAVMVVAAAAASGLIVRRRIDRLDLIAVLKTRE